MSTDLWDIVRKPAPPRAQAKSHCSGRRGRSKRPPLQEGDKKPSWPTIRTRTKQ